MHILEAALVQALVDRAKQQKAAREAACGEPQPAALPNSRMIWFGKHSILRRFGLRRYWPLTASAVRHLRRSSVP